MNKDKFNKILNKTASQSINREACCQHPGKEESKALSCLCNSKALWYKTKDGLKNACDYLNGNCLMGNLDCEAPCCIARRALRREILRSNGTWNSWCGLQNKSR